MDARPLFQTLLTLAEDNVAFFQDVPTETGQRFLAAFTTIREHARCLEPILDHFSAIYHIFDLDEHTLANGYRSLAQTVRCCVAHIIHKSRYVASNRRSIFFRTNHNCAELEAYCTALTQLRALVYLAQHLLTQNRPGYLFNHEDPGLSEQFLREYVTMQKGFCSFDPAFPADHRHQSGVAAGSLFMSGKFAIDPELRGSEFERITQNLDVHFWKKFWNLTETELLASLASMASSQVRLSRALLVPPHSFDLPLVSNPKLTVTITPPVAHTGPGAVQMRLISHELREGQRGIAQIDATGRNAGPRAALEIQDAAPFPLPPGAFPRRGFRSPDLQVARALPEIMGSGVRGAYSFDRLLPVARGSVPTSMPDGGMAAYPVTLLEAAASPSRLLTLLDPLLPLSVLCKCLSAYAGMESEQPDDSALEKLDPMNMMRRNTALLFRDLRLGASALVGSLMDKTGKHNGAVEVNGKKGLPRGSRMPAPLLHLLLPSSSSSSRGRRGTSSKSHAWPAEALRKSASETSLNCKPFASHKDSRKKSQTCQNFLGSSDVQRDPSSTTPEPEDQPTFFFSDQDQEAFSSSTPQGLMFPDGFQPLRSSQPAASLPLELSPIVKNPFMSPLLAPDEMLKGLPPVHIV
ncbi:Hormone-sensitive lipase, partial [Ophiophagus hannah]